MSGDPLLHVFTHARTAPIAFFPASPPEPPASLQIADDDNVTRPCALAALPVDRAVGDGCRTRLQGPWNGTVMFQISIAEVCLREFSMWCAPASWTPRVWNSWNRCTSRKPRSPDSDHHPIRPCRSRTRRCAYARIDT